MRSSTRKRSVPLVLFLILSLFLVACQTTPSSSTGGNSGKVTLSIMDSWSKSDPTGKVFQQVLQQFQKENPTISVHETITPKSNSVVYQYETDFAAGIEPDIAIYNLIGDRLKWLSEGASIPVTDLVQQWGLKDQILPDALQEWTNSTGQLQGFPYTGFKWPVWYNMDILKKAGIDQVPTTTDQLIADAQKLRTAGQGPLVVGGNDWTGNKLFFQIVESYLSSQAAISLFQKGNYCSDPNAVKGIQLFVKLRDAGVFVDSAAGLTADQMDSMFYTAKAAVMSAGSWAFAATPASVTPNVYLGGLPLPGDSTQTKPTAYQGYTSGGFWISPNGQKKLDVVHKFVSFMYRPDIVAQFVENAGVVPAVNNVQAQQGKANALLLQAANQLDQRVSYVVLPDTYVPGDKLDKLQRATSQAFIKGQSVNQICSAIQGAYH